MFFLCLKHLNGFRLHFNIAYKILKLSASHFVQPWSVAQAMRNAVFSFRFLEDRPSSSVCMQKNEFKLIYSEFIGPLYNYVKVRQ